MLKLAMHLDNPGEPRAETRFRDPAALAALGYNGLVLFETTSLSGIEPAGGGAALADPEMRRWVEQELETIRDRIERARTARLGVYLVYDALSLPEEVVAEEGETLACRGAARAICPGSDETLARCGRALEGLLRELPPVEGVVLRFGDTEAGRFPYLLGNTVYSPACPRCRGLGRADRVVRLLEKFHHLVVERWGLRLIARAWNVRPGGMHDRADLAREIAERLPGDPSDDRFVLSFKFTETDFWRYQRWNPASLAVGHRPVIYELQCQREYEGKGSVPDWQVPLWRDGHPETDGDIGLAEAAKRVRLAGLWAWVRGGGWGGPFVRNETWIDANVHAVPALADEPEASPRHLADRWIRERLGVEQKRLAAAIRELLEDSPDFVCQGFYVEPFARRRPDAWHPNGDVIRDDLVDAEAAWRLVQRLPAETLEAVVHEKQAAVERVAHHRAALQRLVSQGNHRLTEPMIHSLLYAESLFETLRDLFGGLVAYRQSRDRGDAAAGEQCRKRLLAAQSHWNHHTQRHGALPGSPTAFRERGFWDVTQRLLDELS